jgi:hypothetical protein
MDLAKVSQQCDNIPTCHNGIGINQLSSMIMGLVRISRQSVNKALMHHSEAGSRQDCRLYQQSKVTFKRN